MLEDVKEAIASGFRSVSQEFRKNRERVRRSFLF